MWVIDASSVIHAWDNYPLDNFPRLWEWFAAELSSGVVVVPRVAYDEIGHVSPECRDWIDDVEGFAVAEVDNGVVAEALAINAILGVDNDRYGSGVDANDVLIVASARSLGFGLVSNEARQPKLPSNPKRFKIPAVCSLGETQTECIDFADLIRRSNRVF